MRHFIRKAYLGTALVLSLNGGTSMALETTYTNNVPEGTIQGTQVQTEYRQDGTQKTTYNNQYGNTVIGNTYDTRDINK